MNYKFKLGVMAVMALVSISVFAGNTYVMATGSKKGVYAKYGMRISKLVPNITVVFSKGSVENLEGLMKNLAQFAIVQKDAYRWYSKKNPGAENKITEIGGLGKECVFLIVNKNGKVKEDSDLQEDGIKIAVGRPGSGSMVTWQYMGALENGFKKATSIPIGGARALSKLTSGSVDAVLFVQSPDTDSWLFRTVNGNDNLEFGNITDWDLNDKLNGKPVYTFEKITTKKGFFGDSVKTICTQTEILVNDHVDEDTIDNLSDAILNHKNYILKGGK